MAAAAAAAWGCGGVWWRAWQRGGGRCPAPAPRRQRAVSCNARGGAVLAGKSGYGAGTARVEWPVEVVPHRGILPSGRSRRVGARPGPGLGHEGNGCGSWAAAAWREQQGPL